MQEISSNPYSEVCFWFGGSYDQFRLLGKLMCISAEEMDPELQQVGSPSLSNASGCQAAEANYKLKTNLSVMQARVEAWKNMDNADPGRQHPCWPHPRTARVEDDTVFEEQVRTLQV